MRRTSALPGFRLTLGFTVAYVGILVVLPLAMLLFRAAAGGFGAFWDAVRAPRVVASLGLSLGAALVAAIIDAILGLIIAWAIARHAFPGRRLVDAIVDLPLALPTAVAGIALTTVCAKTGWVGGVLAPFGIDVAFTRAGVVVALAFVGLPFAVRTVQPVIEKLDRSVEEAAATLGATGPRTFFSVVLPALTPAIRAGFAAAFARALGEYGSVIFVSGNMPFKTEIAPLLIMTKLDSYDYTGATSIGVVLLFASLVLLGAIHALRGKVEAVRAAV